MSLRERLGFSAPPLYLMDGSAFIFRSFYAFRNMSRSDGFPTNAIYMVARLILKLLREEKPESFAFIMDGKGKTYRHELFDAYKAQRTATPEPLVQQLGPLRSMLDALGVPVIVSDGCEADDCIASLACRYREQKPVIILGADKDLKQCLHENVVLWDPSGKDEKVTTLQSFVEETGMQPSSWPDYQALVGDSSDNIPGVPKVGPKSAGELIREFPTLEELFDRLAAVPPKLRSKLEGMRDNAMMYRQLTRLSLDTCPLITEDDLTLKPMQTDTVLGLMAEYELRALSREVESMARAGFLGGAPLKTQPNPATSAPAPAATAVSGTPATASESKPRAQGLLAGNTSGPQIVKPIPSASKTEQVALLLVPVAAPEFEKTASVADLQADKSSILAFLPQPDGLLVASAGRQVIYTGDVAELAASLMRGDSIPTLVTPDCKELCNTYPELWSVPVTHWFDLSLAAYLLSPEDRTYTWQHIVRRWAEPSGSGNDPVAAPGLLALDLYGYMKEQLSGAGLTGVYDGMEMPLVSVLAAMEKRGITIDKKAFAEFLHEVQTSLERLTGQIYALAGRTFNIRSSLQLSDVLFTILELPQTGKTKGGAASTSQESLEKLSGKHPIIDKILEYRILEKLRSTYLEPLPALADEQDRIHTTFNQTATATGRLSSSNPNLQNIPIRGQFGPRMRSCFIAPAGEAPHMSIVCADYSQIELRVLAHLSQDPTLLEAFRNNEDIHRRTAGLLYDVSIDQVTPDMRRNAKTINFGLVYGMGAQKLAQELGIGMKEAKAFIERYFERLGGLKRFYESVEQDACNYGFVVTMAGRRRLTPEILSQNAQLKSQARRQAINTRIQGSAADIIKLAMLAVESDQKLQALDARLLLQVHDELLLEVPSVNAQAAGERLAYLMANVNPGKEPLTVPLEVDWGTGKTWAEAH